MKFDLERRACPLLKTIHTFKSTASALDFYHTRFFAACHYGRNVNDCHAALVQHHFLVAISAALKATKATMQWKIEHQSGNQSKAFIWTTKAAKSCCLPKKPPCIWAALYRPRELVSVVSVSSLTELIKQTPN